MAKRVRSFTKNKPVFLSVVLLFLAVSVAGIGAYLSTAGQAENNISIAENSISILEDFLPPEELYPGVTFTKDVKVTNVGSGSCFVRVLAVFSNGDVGQYCDVDWNDASNGGDWVYNAEDNYWYYPKRLAEGEDTPSLFTTVSLSEDTPEEFIQDFDMIVYAESYQNNHFTDYIEAWENYKKNLPGYQASPEQTQ